MRRLDAVRRRVLQRTGGGDRGHVTAFVVLLVLAALLVAGLVLDGGVALSAKAQAMDTAQEAARAGAQQLDLNLYRSTGVARLDPVKAAAAAQAWLNAAGIDGQARATTTTVTVTVTRTTRTQLLQLVGVRQLHVSASAQATAVQGVTGANR
jgi:Flp pilus assembly protein TadG